MMNLRRRSIVMWIVLGAFVLGIGGGAGFGAFEALSGMFSKKTKNTLAIVNGEKVEFSDYGMVFNQLLMEIGPEALETFTEDDRKQLIKEVWERTIEEAIWVKTLEREQTQVGSGEVSVVMRYSPPQELLADSNWIVNGQFNYEQYHAMLDAPDLPDHIRQFLDYYGTQIARELVRSKVRTDVQNGFRITANQFAEAQMKSGSQGVFEALFIYELPPVDTFVTEAEIQTFYDEHQDLFEREQWWELRMIRFPVVPSAEDSAILSDRIKGAMAAVGQGYEFEQLALDFTRDSSMQVTRPMYTLSAEEFEQMGEIKEGEVAKPFLYRDSWHIVKVVERNEAEITYREISVPLRASDSTRIQLLDKIEEYREKVTPENVDTLTKEYGGSVKVGPYVRESSSIFLRNFPYNDIIKTFAISSKIGDVSEPFPEYNKSYLVFLTADIVKQEILPIDDTAMVNYVKRQVIVEKRQEAQKAYANQLRQEIDAGATFQMLVGRPHVSIDTMHMASYFEMETRYGARQAGACYLLNPGERTGPVKCDVGYGFFHCISKDFDPSSEMVQQGIENEYILLLNRIAEEVFYRGEIKDYRTAFNYQGAD